MTQYLIAPTWERNGYHDSDWYGTFYDSETDAHTLNKLVGDYGYAEIIYTLGLWLAKDEV